MPAAGVSSNNHTYYPMKTYRDKEMKRKDVDVSTRGHTHAVAHVPSPNMNTVHTYVFYIFFFPHIHFGNNPKCSRESREGSRV